MSPPRFSRAAGCRSERCPVPLPERRANAQRKQQHDYHNFMIYIAMDKYEETNACIYEEIQADTHVYKYVHI